MLSTLTLGTTQTVYTQYPASVAPRQEILSSTGSYMKQSRVFSLTVTLQIKAI